MIAERLLRPDIREMEPYAPIVPFDVLSARLGRPAADIVKLDANENPYGPPPGVAAALAAEAYYHIYPDPEAGVLRERIERYVGVPKESLVAGMGADELIDLVLRAILMPGDAVIDCPPSFGMYPFSTAVNGGSYVSVPRLADFSLDLEAIEKAVAQTPRAKVLFVCSPNNPDGSIVGDRTLGRLLALPVLVVLDEAYIDFAEPQGYASRVSWVGRYDNLVVLRTFSKLAGLAGLRVGYGVFPDWLLPHLWKIKQPYNINVAASRAAVAALEDVDWLKEKLGLLVAERERIARELANFDFLRPYPSHSNFTLFRVLGRSAAGLQRELAAEGVLVRHFDKPGLANCIRVSAGRPQDTERLVAALQKIAATQEDSNL
ncbi:MAG: histidinol-phosphate transaminase [Candidatus Promineofilum sp.]|nr:histidinol-phosphate transaminase [Promineifilum sp.]